MADAVDESIPSNPVGEKLREARRAKGMTLDEVAAVTRVPTRHLQHIEKGEWDALPAPTYSVGFARAYAGAVGLSGAEIGAQLRAQLGGAPAHASAQSLYEPTDPARVPPKALVIAAAVIALLIAVGYVVWRSGAVDETQIDPTEVAAVDTPIGAPPPGAQPAPGAARPKAAVPAPASGPVVLTATEDVWLRIYEGNGGQRIMERTLKAGERFEVPATAQRPQILTGRPNALRVTVGQTQIPQLGPAERTIADVSLLPADLLARTQQAPAAAPAPPAAPARAQ